MDDKPPLGPFFKPNDVASLGQLNVDKWVIPGVIPQYGVTVLAAAPKMGKTAFASAMAHAVAIGGEFLGHQIEPGPVFWCSYDEGPEERHEYLRTVPREAPFFTAFMSDLPFLDAPGLDYGRTEDGGEVPTPLMFRRAEKWNGRLIVIDSLHGAVRGASLSDNSHARRVITRLHTWSTLKRVAVLVIHHVVKSSGRGAYADRVADSPQILAGARCFHVMEVLERENGTRRITLHSAGRHPAPPRLQVIESPNLHTFQLAECVPEAVRLQTTAGRVQELLAQGWTLTREEIALRLGLNPGTVGNALTNLQRSGIIARSDKRKRKPTYCIGDDPEIEENLHDPQPAPVMMEVEEPGASREVHDPPLACPPQESQNVTQDSAN